MHKGQTSRSKRRRRSQSWCEATIEFEKRKWYLARCCGVWRSPSKSQPAEYWLNIGHSFIFRKGLNIYIIKGLKCFWPTVKDFPKSFEKELTCWSAPRESSQSWILMVIFAREVCSRHPGTRSVVNIYIVNDKSRCICIVPWNLPRCIALQLHHSNCFSTRIAPPENHLVTTTTTTREGYKNLPAWWAEALALGENCILCHNTFALTL